MAEFDKQRALEIFSGTGQQINFRPIEDVDLELIAKWRNDAETAKYFFSTVPDDIDNQRKWFSEAAADPDQINLLVLDDKHIPLGMIALVDIAKDLNSAELGRFLVGESRARNTGLGQAALNKFLVLVFTELGVKELRAYVHTWNQRAIHVYEKVGFRPQPAERPLSSVNKSSITMMLLKRDQFINKAHLTR